MQVFNTASSGMIDNLLKSSRTCSQTSPSIYFGLAYITVYQDPHSLM